MIESGKLYSWGNNYWGKLGIGGTESDNKTTPCLVDIEGPIIQIAACTRHSMALNGTFAIARNTIRHNTTRNTIQHNTTRITTQRNITLHNTIHTVSYHEATYRITTIKQGNTTQHNVTQRNTTQHNITHNLTQHNITYRITIQHNTT